jgi:hypothetical protein
MMMLLGPLLLFAIWILVATLAHYFLVPPYGLVNEMQEAERTARFLVVNRND